VRLGNRPLSCERQHWAVLDVDLRRGHEVSEAERRATTVFDRMRCQGLSYEVLKMTATHCHFVGFVGFVGEWSHGLRLSLADNREVEPAERSGRDATASRSPRRDPIDQRDIWKNHDSRRQGRQYTSIRSDLSGDGLRLSLEALSKRTRLDGQREVWHRLGRPRPPDQARGDNGSTAFDIRRRVFPRIRY
jgi:hypothetical protein